MPLNRSAMIAFFLAATMPLAASAGDVYVPQPTDDERLMISTMLERGVPNFIMLNEKQGLIKLIQNGRLFLVSPAASGAVKGDDAEKNPRVTPAGIFPLTDFNDGKYIEYYALGKNAYLIHATTPRRDSLLMEKNPNKFRASEGCIAVPREVFVQIRSFLKQNSNPTLVVLPEERDVSAMLGLAKKPAPR